MYRVFYSLFKTKGYMFLSGHYAINVLKWAADDMSMGIK